MMTMLDGQPFQQGRLSAASCHMLGDYFFITPTITTSTTALRSSWARSRERCGWPHHCCMSRTVITVTITKFELGLGAAQANEYIRTDLLH